MNAPTQPLGRAPDRDRYEDPCRDNSVSRCIVNSVSLIPLNSAVLSNARMQTVEEIRLEWLNILIERHGTIASLNAALGRTRTDATLSQLKNQAPDSKSGTPKNMGSPLAREIEDRLGLERGTLDNPP